MSDEVTASAGEDSSIVEIPGSDKQSGSVRDAARTLAQFRHKQREPDANPAPERPEATAQPESGEQPEPATAEAQPSGEQTEAADTPYEAPIDPPKSWTKEAKERFASLPRDTQEYLAQREDERDRDISRRQNETAEKLKGLTAKEQQVEQARLEYEYNLPRLQEQIKLLKNRDFPDIKTMDDVQRLAREDWPRYVLWDAQQKLEAAVDQETQTARQRQFQEQQQKFADYIKTEGELAAKLIPELADRTKADKLFADARRYLIEVGLSEDEIGSMGRGEKGISIQDHRFQVLVHDAMRYRAAEVNAKKIAAKPLPPVQRPGVSQPRGAAQHALVENLTKQLAQSGSLKDAARLITERRKAG